MSVVLTKSFANLIEPILTSLYIGLVKQNGEECFGGGYKRQLLGSVDICDDDTYIYIQNIFPITFPLANGNIALANNPVSKIRLFKDDTTTDTIATIDLPYAKPYMVQDQLIIPPYALNIKIQKTYT